MGPIAKAVTKAVWQDDDAWFWWADCQRISDIHRRQAWPSGWRDDAVMRCAVRYPETAPVRNAIVLREAA